MFLINICGSERGVAPKPRQLYLEDYVRYVSSCALLVVHCWLFTAGCSLLVVHCWLCAAGCALLVVLCNCNVMSRPLSPLFSLVIWIQSGVALLISSGSISPRMVHSLASAGFINQVALCLFAYLLRSCFSSAFLLCRLSCVYLLLLSLLLFLLFLLLL